MSIILFCHGVPGSPADADLLRTENPNARIVPLDLFSLGPDFNADDIRSALAAEGVPNGPAHAVGFSIGTMAAIRATAICPELVSRLTLISPAAPLQLGRFLPDMAGKPVFEMALRRPLFLGVLARAQGLMARLAPSTLINLLFARCGASEKALLADPAFQTIIKKGLRNSLVRHPDAYQAYVTAYVQDWSDLIARVDCPVDLWHGTKDTWSPPAMSDALVAALGARARLTCVPDAEHYSTLAHVLLDK